MIKEIWGNGTDVVVKYMKNGLLWVSASKWMANNSDMSEAFLKKNGYRLIERR